jgi:hypothetical protein
MLGLLPSHGVVTQVLAVASFLRLAHVSGLDESCASDEIASVSHVSFRAPLVTGC